VPPHPGDPPPGFVAEAGGCWRMVYTTTSKSTHCRDDQHSQAAGSRRAPMGSGGGCGPASAISNGLTAVREFGRRPV
jgi:hypothetical protein